MGRPKLPSPSLEQIVRRAQILVVDDQDFPYEVLFRDAGYNITKWDHIVKLEEIEQGRYDLVLLDLQGIGRDLSKDQGLGVLRHLKTVRPSQVVVAYSNADWGVQYKSFFDLADRVLPKTADYVDFRREVDELLLEHFSVGFHVQRLSKTLAEVGISGWRARSAIDKAVAGNAAPLTGLLKRHGIDHETTQSVLGLAQVALGVAQVWMSAS